jgi:hypothetical protein
MRAGWKAVCREEAHPFVQKGILVTGFPEKGKRGYGQAMRRYDDRCVNLLLSDCGCCDGGF